MTNNRHPSQRYACRKAHKAQIQWQNFCVVLFSTGSTAAIIERVHPDVTFVEMDLHHEGTLSCVQSQTRKYPRGEMPRQTATKQAGSSLAATSFDAHGVGWDN